MPTHRSEAPQSERGLWEPPTLQTDTPSLRNTAYEQEDARPTLRAYYSFKETEILWGKELEKERRVERRKNKRHRKRRGP